MNGSNENCFEFLRDQKTVTATVCQGRYVSKLKKLAEDYPEKCKIDVENNDNSYVFHFPVEWLRINPKRELSEEEKERLADRARNNFGHK